MWDIAIHLLWGPVSSLALFSSSNRCGTAPKSTPIWGQRPYWHTTSCPPPSRNSEKADTSSDVWLWYNFCNDLQLMWNITVEEGNECGRRHWATKGGRLWDPTSIGEENECPTSGSWGEVDCKIPHQLVGRKGERNILYTDTDVEWVRVRVKVFWSKKGKERRKGVKHNDGQTIMACL